MPLKPEGRVIRVGKVEVRVYPISKLAQEISKALNSERTTQTIRKWEIKGVIPPAMFKVAGNRMYSMEQIKCIARIAKEEGIKQGCSESMAKFSSRVEKELLKINKRFMAKAQEGAEAKERK